ncbi:hypothetical protein [Persicobacter diffluens]|uniref:Uncharacterized protein n=1 Tax=Persicobacter diffluens TaxID=981 RepID=A0AAN4VYS0_9BACT|nr:hypothetical protein PEDI_24790 [Persicobacter diffluens]
MKNKQIHNDLHALERKVRLILAEHQQLKQEVQNLRAENQQLQQALQAKDEQISDFKNQLNISSIAGNLKDGVLDTSGLKVLIDEYISEIDKCVTHLSK